MSTISNKRPLDEKQNFSPPQKKYKEDPNNLPKQAYHTLYGDNSTVELTRTIHRHLKGRETKLKIHDLHHLILYLLQDKVPSPKWIEVKHKHAVKKIVMIQVDGLTEEIATTLPIFEHNFSPQTRYPLKLDTSLYSDSGVMEKFLKVDVSKLDFKRPRKNNNGGKSYWAPEHFILSKSELRGNDYPIWGQEQYKDFLSTKDWSEATDPQDILAIDCEMVETSVGQELCQCSVVDWNGKTLMDHLVLPRRHIICYNTQWSGVSASTLEGVTRRLEDVQRELVSKWVTNKTIILGHSLENDLKALRLVHTRVIDTSVLFPHYQGSYRKNSLKWLTNQYLQRKIQQGDGSTGHNPVEDALAALELVKLKLKHGPSFGVNVSEKRSLAKLLRRSNMNMHIFGSLNVTNRIRSDPVNITSLVSIDPNRTILAKVPKAFSNPEMHLVWVQLIKGFMDPLDNKNEERVNETLSSLWEAAPAKTVIIIHTGRRSRKRLKALQQKKIMARIRKGPPMKEAETLELARLKRAMTSHHFWVAVKNENEEVSSDSSSESEPKKPVPESRT